MTKTDLVVRIDPAEIVALQQDGKTIVFNPAAEDAIIRLLEIQREVDGAVEYLKAEIERQGLEYNPNFSSVKGDKIKVNYSAAGAKYGDNGNCKKRSPKFWKKTVKWGINSAAVDKYRAEKYRLPAGIVSLPRSKKVQFKEVKGNAE